MLKFFALTLLALHCNCQDVIEVRGDNVIRQSGLTHLPLKTYGGYGRYGGFSTINQGLPVSSYLSGLPALNYGLNINGHNLGYLRSNYLQGNSFNVAPSVYGVSVPQQQVYAIRQPSVQQIGFQHLAQPVVQNYAQHVSVARPALAIAQQQFVRPQAYASEAVRPVNAAIQQVGRTVEYRDVPNIESPVVPQDVIVDPSDQPINIHFRSRSSTVRISQEHIPGEPGTVEQTSSQDEPSKVIHEVVKPVIQEVREVIQPYRQVTQEVQPVVENVHRVVSSGENRQQYVAEPIVRQVQPIVQAVRQVQPIVQAVRHVQPLSVAVAQPQIAVARHAFAVAQPQIAVSRPAFAVAQRGISIAQPAISSYDVEPQYHHVQPIVSQIIRQPYIQSIANQPIIGYARSGYTSRVESEELPSISVRQEIREPIREVVREERQRGGDFVKYVESN